MDWNHHMERRLTEVRGVAVVGSVWCGTHQAGKIEPWPAVAASFVGFELNGVIVDELMVFQ